MKNDLTQEELKSLFNYNPQTGEFTRKYTTGGQEKGQVAGGIGSHDIIYIRIPGRDKYVAHRLAWLYMTGEFPFVDIDHIDHNRSNNRWSNLRIATRSQNKANYLHKAGISGTRGVWPHHSRWRASIKINQKIQKVYYELGTPIQASRGRELG